MQSKIQNALAPAYEPVAMLWAEDKPEKALQFKKGRFSCVMFGFANAARGRAAVFDRETYGCWGGGVGLGFGNTYTEFPGGEQGFHYFLSCGNAEWVTGQQIGEGMQQAGVDGHFVDEFLQGERYRKGPREVADFVEALPIQDIPATYVVMKPLSHVSEEEVPKVVTFLANAEQLSALVVLANYGRQSIDAVRIPFAAGCQSVGLLPLEEENQAHPRAVVGLTDISARAHVRKLLGRDLLTFSMPWSLYQEMEANVEGSFFDRPTWQGLTGTQTD